MKTAEDLLVRRIARVLGSKGRNGLVLGVGDDAALLKPRSGYQLILTCDWFLDGSHFLRDKHPPDSVGWKCLARALSDIAAMGGWPKYFLLSLALPGTYTGRWLDGFLRGLGRASKRFGCALAGGDTTKNDKILINVSVTGEVRTGRAVLRSGAKTGNLIFVSGRLGEAELGLRTLRRGRGEGYRKNPRLQKHLYPEPRLALGQWLSGKRLATAMMDMSDGLSTDLSRLCAASGVGAQIAVDKIPKARLSKEKARMHLDLTELALHGGDDYELLFTVRANQAGRVPPVFRGLALTCVGEITSGPQLMLMGREGYKEELAPRGWDPF